jgi:hypothetical protein
MRPIKEEYDNEFIERIKNNTNSCSYKNIYDKNCDFNGKFDINYNSGKLSFKLKDGILNSKKRHVNLQIKNYEIISMNLTTINDNNIQIYVDKPNEVVHFECTEYQISFSVKNKITFDSLYYNEFYYLISIFRNFLTTHILTDDKNKYHNMFNKYIDVMNDNTKKK